MTIKAAAVRRFADVAVVDPSTAAAALSSDARFAEARERLWDAFVDHALGELMREYRWTVYGTLPEGAETQALRVEALAQWLAASHGARDQLREAATGEPLLAEARNGSVYYRLQEVLRSRMEHRAGG